MWTQDVNVSNSEILFDLINWSDDSSSIVREADSFLKSLATQASHVSNEINGFNSSLEAKIAQVISLRKNELLKKSNLLSSLGVPIQKLIKSLRPLWYPSQKRSNSQQAISSYFGLRSRTYN